MPVNVECQMAHTQRVWEGIGRCGPWTVHTCAPTDHSPAGPCQRCAQNRRSIAGFGVLLASCAARRAAREPAGRVPRSRRGPAGAGRAQTLADHGLRLSDHRTTVDASERVRAAEQRARPAVGASSRPHARCADLWRPWERARRAGAARRQAQARLPPTSARALLRRGPNRILIKG